MNLTNFSVAQSIAVERIANDHLGITTLNDRSPDGREIVQLAFVADIREALAAAFNAGRESGYRSRSR